MPVKKNTEKFVILPNEVKEALRSYFNLKEGTSLTFEIGITRDPTNGDFKVIFEGATATRVTRVTD